MNDISLHYSSPAGSLGRDLVSGNYRSLETNSVVHLCVDLK